MAILYSGDKSFKKAFTGTGRIRALYRGVSLVYGKGFRGSVHIGENDYPYVKVGSLYWTAENLKETISGEGTWYDSNQSKYEPLRYGRLYRYGSFIGSIGSMLPSGWRVPTKADCEALMAELGDDYLSYMAGTGSSGFDGVYSGFMNYAEEYTKAGVSFAFWTTTSRTETTNECLYTNNSLQAVGLDNFNTEKSRCSIRLCMNA